MDHKRRGPAWAAAWVTSQRLGRRHGPLRSAILLAELGRLVLFGRRSQKAVLPDQLQLALEDIGQALAEPEVQEEKTDATLKASRRVSIAARCPSTRGAKRSLRARGSPGSSTHEADRRRLLTEA